jgi:osmotically-inducible protein OsmY
VRKGYRRSDEKIHEDVCQRLTEHPGIDASDIEVAVSDGDVTLTGRVESRAVKHLTEVMVETVSGVKEVHNQLRVAPLEGGEWSRPPSEERRETRAQETVAPKTRRR